MQDKSKFIKDSIEILSLLLRNIILTGSINIVGAY